MQTLLLNEKDGYGGKYTIALKILQVINSLLVSQASF